MTITTNNPISIPAANYPYVAFPLVQIRWGNLNAPIYAEYIVAYYATDDAGVNTFAPVKPKKSVIQDLTALATTRAQEGKPALATAMQAVLTALTEIETENGNI